MPDRSLEPLAPLADPVRRALYTWVVAQPDAVDRDAAAAAAGIERPLAAFHLDRLARDGLLATEYRRRTGRTGPGAGRPAKFYRRAPDREIEVTLPPRRYSLVADLLASGVEASADAATAALASADARGRALGRAAVAAGQDAVADLVDGGYEPVVAEDGSILLRNCPFHAIADAHRDLVCSMNRAFLGAFVDEAEPARDVRLDPAPGQRCCVVIGARTPAEPV